MLSILKHWHEESAHPKPASFSREQWLAQNNGETLDGSVLGSLAKQRDRVEASRYPTNIFYPFIYSWTLTIYLLTGEFPLNCGEVASITRYCNPAIIGPSDKESVLAIISYEMIKYEFFQLFFK